MQGLIYIVIDSREDDGIYNGYFIDSVWTSERKAQKRCDELNANLEKEPIWGVGLYQVVQKWIQNKYKAESEPQESDIDKRKPCINYSDGCEEWAGCPCVYYKAESEE